MRQQVMLNWRAGTSFGWGLVGLNLLQCWGSDPEIQPLLGERITAADCHGMDPLRALAISRAVAASNEFVGDLKADKVDWHERPLLLVDSVGNGLNVSMPQYRARRNVGRCILEDTHIADATLRLAKYDSLVCGSRWGSALLRSHTSKPVALVHEESMSRSSSLGRARGPSIQGASTSSRAARWSFARLTTSWCWHSASSRHATTTPCS